MSGGGDDALYSDLEEQYTFDMISVAEEEEGVDVADAGQYEWYVQAESDLKRYLEEVGVPGEEEEEEEATVTEEEEGGDLLENNRSASYTGWEDDELDEWGVDEITGRRRHKGVTYYKVKWTSHPEETWETEEDLVEEGHEPLIKAFNKAKTHAAAGKLRGPRPVKKILSSFEPEKLWPDFLERIRNKFKESLYHATEVYTICNADLAKNFVKLLSDSVPVMLFHGTRGCFIESIIRNGLKIPGRGGVRVVNGSAYGVGIYTGVNPGTSHYYAHNTGYMFVCAGLVSGRFSTSVKQPGSMVVFFNESLVLPCFLVKYTCSGSGSTLPVHLACESRPDFSEMYGEDAQAAAAASAAAVGAFTRVHMPPVGRTPIYNKVLTKKELRAAPRAVKEAYKTGQIYQKKSKK